MNWSDYEAAWKRQELPKGNAADLSDLHATFEGKSRKLAGALVVRDWSEIAASIVVISFYFWYWSKVGSEGWPMAFAIGLISLVALIFLRERLRARRLRLGREVAMLKKIEADLTELQHQRHMLANISWWYILPCIGAITLHSFVIMGHLPESNLLNTSAGRIAHGGMMMSLGYFIWWINRRAVRRQIDPRIIELEKLRDDILSDENGTL